MLKTILLALFSKFAKGHSKQIAKGQKWIDSAQATFASAVEEAELAEKKFDFVVSDAEKKIAELQSILDQSKEKKTQASNFKNKIQSFIEE
ncbi:hypothetical protein [Bacillus atrophaeus]|uniref:hypothetical protein n=1 Tax=Bacillus atrophaeus TaxID=1452 RepID=UPI002E2478C6|nr:hypothetical protein [Bacillus atrophaeus]